jgi:hypothetical protein
MMFQIANRRFMGQQPVYSDNATIFGDGTEEHPLSTVKEEGVVELTLDTFQVTADSELLTFSMNGPLSGPGGIEITNQDTVNQAGITIDDFSGGNIEILEGVDGALIIIGGDSAGVGLSIGTTTADSIGFFGVTPVQQQTHPTTLAEVIAILAAYGLSA